MSEEHYNVKYCIEPKPIVSFTDSFDDEIEDFGFNLLCAPLIPEGVIAKSDMLLSCGQWAEDIIGVISPECIEDSKKFQAEMGWATYLGITYIMFAPFLTEDKKVSKIEEIKEIKEDEKEKKTETEEEKEIKKKKQSESIHDKNTNYIRMINSTLKSTTSTDFIIPFYLSDKNSWNKWNEIRLMTESYSSFYPALILDSSKVHTECIESWMGENVKALIIPSDLFAEQKTRNRNSKQSAFQLPKQIVQLIKHFMIKDIDIILRQSEGHKVRRDLHKQFYYLRKIEKSLPKLSNWEIANRDFEDCLQDPLQPLKDNLESSSYAVFEDDTIKYELYEKAVYKALLDFAKLRKKEDPKINLKENPIVVMLVGSGRGGIVRRCIIASHKSKVPIRLYAIEKNPSAVITLRNNKWEYDHEVIVVDTDMRVWNPPEKCDIMVSELLGSFGDNELSPECLDGAQKILKKGGISIPSEYNSFMCPISTPRLFNELFEKKNNLKGLETSYVVNFGKYKYLSNIQKVFTFTHPLPKESIKKDNSHNDRFKSFNFVLKNDSLIHGFAGFFDAILYKDVKLSTNPIDHTPQMASWFPIYFPIQKPVFVKAGDNFKASMWRCTSNDLKRVFYEWTVTSPVILPIHNVNGRSSSIDL
ncbi:protein arginine n-methyltransferase 5 [Anaeramoeba flamelloides]|uniref:Protein arginine N-methyltransferase n=1 Tax=Anaeramoeba flamelloides TaxID=1746091 RepID=A0ABQ8Z7C9_9EUKA|nr:protein arginine n-methyltransferase 5 [Anaeramoeba flamelloides]